MRSFLLLSLLSLVFISCQKNVIVKHDGIAIEFDEQMRTRIYHPDGLRNSISGDFLSSEYLLTLDGPMDEFEIIDKSVVKESNTGARYLITGISTEHGQRIEKSIKITTIDSLPGFLLQQVQYINRGEGNLRVTGWVCNRYSIQDQEPADDSHFWSFQGSSSGERADWILPVTPGFHQKNYMGMNNSDYGGGIPVVNVWRKDAGIATGHIELVPKLVSLPVEYNEYDDFATIGIEKTFEDAVILSTGDTLDTYETFISLHAGDCFSVLKGYSGILRSKGLQFEEPEEASFEPVWCAWGYERDFTVDEILGTLPKVRELGIHWAVIDDGYQQAEGDWEVNARKFPGGENGIKRLVDKIHSYDMKAKLWYAPLAVDPGSKLLARHPDIILRNEDWSPRDISWWDSYYMSPTKEETLEHTRNVVHMFMSEWGFDGLKLDGQHMNGVPPDYSLEHPEQAVEQLPVFFKEIYKEARSCKPNAVVENCPCGCCMSIYNMTSLNQTVASDPLSSWQIRLKGKVYRAIIPEHAYYGDHVEISDQGSDFASAFGIGGVLGTKFTWPADNPAASASYLLTPEKEVIWKKWFSLYNELMLCKGNYLGDLYDIGFDQPETHVIEKEGNLYFAFYADSWDGNIQFRGLDKGVEYSVFDYINNTSLGTVTSDSPSLNTNFKGSLLVKLK
jgi:alpha-galactosidase